MSRIMIYSLNRFNRYLENSMSEVKNQLILIKNFILFKNTINNRRNENFKITDVFIRKLGV